MPLALEWTGGAAERLPAWTGSVLIAILQASNGNRNSWRDCGKRLHRHDRLRLHLCGPLQNHRLPRGLPLERNLLGRQEKGKILSIPVAP